MYETIISTTGFLIFNRVYVIEVIKLKFLFRGPCYSSFVMHDIFNLHWVFGLDP